jgi:hypothetical protein
VHKHIRQHSPDVPHPIGVEVGVLKGVNASRLLADWQDLFLVLVDHWGIWDAPLPEYEQGWKVYNKCVENLRPYRDRCLVLQCSSVAAAVMLPDAWFDFVFLDADHRYEATRNSIYAWLPKVKSGGTIGGHDYAIQKNQYGWNVKDAVDEFVVDYGCELRRTQTDCWFVGVK